MEKERKGWNEQSLTWQILLGLVAVPLVLAVIFLGGLIFRSMFGEGYGSVGTLAIQVGLAMGAVTVAIVGMRRQHSTEETLELERQRNALDAQKEDRAQVAGLRDRYTTSAQQLGDSSAAIRLAGVYAMAALAVLTGHVDRRSGAGLSG